MTEITYNDLPKAITILTHEVSEIKQLLLSKSIQPSEASDQLLTIQEAADFLTLAVPTLYSMVSRGELPHMKRSKRLYFSKKDLIEYVQAGRKKTVAEIQEAAGQHLKLVKYLVIILRLFHRFYSFFLEIYSIWLFQISNSLFDKLDGKITFCINFW